VIAGALALYDYNTTLKALLVDTYKVGERFSFSIYLKAMKSLAQSDKLPIARFHLGNP
jgi:hypothetical protein